MKIQCLSDLHLEFGGLDIINKIKNANSDIVVLAGDTHVGSKKIKNSVTKIYEAVRKPIILIPGNHEYYGFTKKVEDDLYKDLFKDNKYIYFLNDNFLDLDGVIFIGSTGWWEIKPDPNIRFKLNDFNLIKDIFKNEDGVVWGIKSRNFMTECMDKYSNRKIVCITHHAPSIKSVPKKYIADPLNIFFINNREDLIEKYSPKLWIHGHTHDSFSYTINDTQIICNPRGYHGYEINKNFDYKLMYEL